MSEVLRSEKEEHTDEDAEQQEKLPDKIAEARNALRDFAAKEKSYELHSSHFLPGITLKEEFNDADIPDEEITIFPKARDKTLTDEEYNAYRGLLLDKGGLLKAGVNSSRHALLQYVNNVMFVIRGRKQIAEELKKLSQK